MSHLTKIPPRLNLLLNFLGILVYKSGGYYEITKEDVERLTSTPLVLAMDETCDKIVLKLERNPRD